MILQKIKLQNFRSYTKAEFDLDKVTVVVGENGSGKSNLMEAIYLAAIGRSFRAERDIEMIRYGEQFSILNFQFSNNDQITNFQITIADRKKFEVNGVARRMIDAVGKFRAILFSPQDLELVTGGPSGRRRYLDFVISQKDREYRRCLISYEKGLRQRNKLLDMLREGLADRNQLFFWDRLLIKNGEYITQAREAYLAYLADGEYQAEYDQSIISEVRLKQYEQEEVAAATTLVGPHRDDFVVNLAGRDVSKFGSRGEQRMAVLWLKKGEMEFLSLDFARDAQKPLLLLDDIFSELDHRHREEVSRLVEEHQRAEGQVVLTAADPHLLPVEGKWQQIRLPI